MNRLDLSNSIAAEMDKVLHSEENKQMFSSASVLEKLAFSRVADEGKLTSEVEEELNKGLEKKAASSCKCDKKHGSEKSCDCPSDCSCREKASSKSAEIVSTLLKVSEDLENNGFEKLAALSIVLAEKLVVEAKAKSKPKSKESEKSSKSKSEKSSKKMTMKERMEKMRKMQKGKKSGKSKKSSLEVELSKRGQVANQPPPQNINPQPAPKREAEVILNALPPNAKGTLVEVQLNDVKVHPGNMVPLVTKVVQKLQEANQLPSMKRYRIVPA